MEKLIRIQTKLKAPKGQTNSFGGYQYRSCEDILEAVKPLLAEEGLLLTITDEMVEIGGRVYVKATAKISDGEQAVKVSAYAREAETKKGMDDAQLTGACSSYARKYALNGLFLIDDAQDADTQDNTTEVVYIDDKQLSTIRDYIDNFKDFDEAQFLKYCKAESVDKIAKKNYNSVVILLEKKKKEEK